MTRELGTIMSKVLGLLPVALRLKVAQARPSSTAYVAAAGVLSTLVLRQTGCEEDNEGGSIRGKRVLFTTPPSYAPRLRDELEKVTK